LPQLKRRRIHTNVILLPDIGKSRIRRRRVSCTVLVLNPQCGNRDQDLVEDTLTSRREAVSTETASTQTSRRCSLTRIVSGAIGALLDRRCGNHRFQWGLASPTGTLSRPSPHVHAQAPNRGGVAEDILAVHGAGCQNIKMLEPETIAFVNARFPQETIVEGGPAKCIAISSELLDKYTARKGRGPMPQMSAEWAATDTALYYVIPSLEEWWRIPWDDISRVKFRRRSWLVPTRKLTVESLRGDKWKWSMGNLASVELARIARTNRVIVSGAE